MALERVLEPEVMDTEEDAREDDAMDHNEVNERRCADLPALRAALRRTVGVGTGTALIPIALCRRAEPHIIAFDAAEALLARGRQTLAGAGFAGRIELAAADARKLPL